MAEQELRDIIQRAWCDGDNSPKDKFGDFLTRAAKYIKEAGYVKIKRGDIYWTKEQLSAKDVVEKFYKD